MGLKDQTFQPTGSIWLEVVKKDMEHKANPINEAGILLRITVSLKKKLNIFEKLHTYKESHSRLV